jgi:hypothetical protein
MNFITNRNFDNLRLFAFKIFITNNYNNSELMLCISGLNRCMLSIECVTFLVIVVIGILQF